ncbi:glycoside hydrolase superfamily [Leucosporidium creatinivorum]|uniref:mannan endo-1,4-beta-mannosidase n=1 Tax=Leucosporidium creatinivorum TaxID=106004 RepID=A0A1Y2G333_9BASI|nr:glycoside hydrolase superfamily [Leucosporidium creatinivorum]
MNPLPTAFPTPSTFVKRNGTRLQLDGEDFTAVGPNIYWLALDENVEPYPSITSRSRVLEIMGIAQAMGATAIRGHTVGVNLGSAHAVENALGQFNEQAFAAVDWAIWAAKSHGLRLIVPLTDQYDYYHGGIPTFLRWRNLSASSPADYGPFYDLNSNVYSDFKTYISTLLTHRSNITGLTMAEEPTILAFETGNELGGWGGNSSPPPVAWTTAIAAYLKELAPDTLVLSGSYGVRKDELAIQDVDMVSNHFYPPYSYNLKKSADLAYSGNKVFINGEFDWTDRYYLPLAYLAILVPALLAASVWIMPRRWWPWRVSLGCCCCRGRRRREKGYEGVGGARDVKNPLGASTSSLTAPTPLLAEDHPSSYPPSPIASPALPTPTSAARRPLIDRSFPFHRWHFSLFLLLLCAPVGAIIHAFMPTPLGAFLSSMESLSSESKLAGSFYWSLFGKDDSCCAYVEHNDGYTLHYPSDGTKAPGSGDRVAELARHAWRMRGVSPSYLGGESLSTLGVGSLPTVQCPQEALAVPANATWSGGTGGNSTEARRRY